MPRENQTTKAVLKYYQLKAGQLIHYADAAEALDIPKTQVNAALARLHGRHPEAGIRREGLAGHYIWRQSAMVAAPEKPKDETTYYEKVGETRDGVAVVRSDNGNLYTLMEL